MKAQTRLPVLDILRGLAVVWMVIFHFAYDLKMFQWTTFPDSWSWFWWWFPRIIVGSFLFVMGASWAQAAKKETSLTPFLKRFTKLCISAGLVSVATYLLFPDRWVYFGTLHCIAFCSLALFIFHRRALLGWITLGLIIASEFAGLRPAWIDLGHPSMDYIPPFPWLGFALLGYLTSEHLSRITSAFFHLPVFRLLVLPGRHSLKIYLLHQPIIFGSFWVIHWFLNKN